MTTIIVPKEFQCDDYSKQSICKVGFMETIDNFAKDGDFVYIKEARIFNPDVDEMTVDALRALMYSYIFKMKATLAIVGLSEAVIVLDEREQKNRRDSILPKNVLVDKKVVTEAFNELVNGLVRLHEEYDELTYSKRVELIGDLKDKMDKEDLFVEEDGGPEYGVCCFCEGPCNPASQACGRCVRRLW